MISDSTVLPDSLPDDAFNAIADKWASLDGRCYSWKTEQYTYELCPFRNMTQKSTNNAIMGYVSFA